VAEDPALAEARLLAQGEAPTALADPAIAEAADLGQRTVTVRRHTRLKGAPNLGKIDRLTRMLLESLMRPVRELGTVSAAPFALLPASLRERLPAGVVPTGEEIREALPGAASTAVGLIPGVGTVGGLARGLPLLPRLVTGGAAIGTAMGGTRALVAGEPLPQIAEEAGEMGLFGGGLGLATGGIARGAPELMQALRGLFRRPRPIAKPVASIQAAEAAPVPPLEPPQDVVQRLTTAIRAAGPVRKEQEKLFSAERAKRAARAAGAMEQIGGEQGFFRALGTLKGELPKASFESVRKEFGQGEIDQLFNMIQRAPLSVFDKVHAQSGLTKLIGLQGGSVPQESELTLLRQVFGPELVESALSRRPLMQRVGSTISDVLNVPRSLMASFDLSAAGRQGLLMVSRPEYWRALGPMVRSFKSEKVFRAIQDDISSHPTYPLMQEAKLALTDIGQAAVAREEPFAAQIAERIPIAGAVIRASGRAYVGFLNKVRADVFDNAVRHARESGAEVTPEFTRSLADWINTFTGRGRIGALEPAAKILNGVFFSPRLMAARLQVLNPQFYTSLQPQARREALRTLLSSTSGVVGVLGVAALSGARVGIDPRSADFGKIRIGNTRIDLLAGYQQPIRLAAQLLTGTVVSSTTGKEMVLGDPGKFRPLTRIDIIARWFENKTSPVASFILDLARGVDNLGQPIRLREEILSRIVPMAWQDTWEAIQEWGTKGALAAPLVTVGIGVQTYSGRPLSWSFTRGGRQVRLRVSSSAARAFTREIEQADQIATSQVLRSATFSKLSRANQDRMLERLIGRYRDRIKRRWEGANFDTIRQAVQAQREEIELTESPQTLAREEQTAAGGSR